MRERLTLLMRTVFSFLIAPNARDANDLSGRWEGSSGAIAWNFAGNNYVFWGRFWGCRWFEMSKGAFSLYGNTIKLAKDTGRTEVRSFSRRGDTITIDGIRYHRAS